MNASEVLFDTVQRQPKKTALIFKDELYTYRQLAEKVKQLANGMRDIGINPGDRVGLFMRNYPEYIISYFATLSIGACVVPLNFIFQEKEVTFILNDSEAVAVIADSEFVDTIDRSKPNLTTIKHIITAGGAPVSGKRSLEDIMKSSDGFEIIQREVDDIAQIIYTSGTTGTPKGAMIPHSNLKWMAGTCQTFYRIGSEDRVLCVLPLFHAYAKLQCMLSPINGGATVVLMDKFEPLSIMKEMVGRMVTVFFGVPTMFVMLVNSPYVDNYDFSNLRCCVSGGASIPVEIIKSVKEKMNIDICEGYGLTECTVLSTCNPYDGVHKHGSIGPAIPGVEVKVFNADDKEVPVGEIGELVIKGPNVMKGYYNKPEETGHSLRNGWLHTGDMAIMDEDGYLYIVDRKKDMYIRGGYNVYPREVEEVIFTNQKVVEVAVIGVPDRVYGEEGKAYIVLKNGENASEAEIIDFCRSKLAKYKVPKYVEFVDELPKTATGKLNKKALRQFNLSQPPAYFQAAK